MSAHFGAHLGLRLRHGTFGSTPVSTGSVPMVHDREMEGGKVERNYADGTRVVVFKNGTEKEVCGGDPATAPLYGRTVVRYANGDVKVTGTLAGGLLGEAYRYAESGIIQTTYPALRANAFDFPSGQAEMHWPDGSKEIVFPDGRVAVVPASPAAAPSSLGAGLASPGGTPAAAAAP